MEDDVTCLLHWEYDALLTINYGLWNSRRRTDGGIPFLPVHCPLGRVERVSDVSPCSFFGLPSLFSLLLPQIRLKEQRFAVRAFP